MELKEIKEHERPESFSVINIAFYKNTIHLKVSIAYFMWHNINSSK